MIPATIGLSATQINIFINTNFASSCVEGSVSWLNYAFRLVQLPIGLFGVAISIAALPVLARQASTNNLDQMRTTFVSSLTMVFCLTVPATIGLIVLAEPIIRLIFERGAFTAADTQATAIALSLYGIGLFAYSANKVIVPVYYAINATRYPVIASFLAIGFNVVIIISTIDYFQHRAIALSTSVVMIINFLFLMVVLYRRIDGFPLRTLMAGLVKIASSAGVMTVVLLFFYKLFSAQFHGTIWHQITFLLLLILLSSTSYIAVLHLLGLQELNDIVTKLRGRMAR
jgi:putative peptidoglycan lipid II flippase